MKNTRKKILLVDDNKDIIEAIKILLQESGFEVYSAQTIHELYDFLEDTLPDLILLDVLLSGKDGREIAKELKSNPKTKIIPIIMLSAHPSANETATASGADAFIAKPFDVDYLLEVMHSFIK